MILKRLCLLFLAALMTGALLTGLMASVEPNTNQILQTPSFAHLFGTDSLGRDLLFRVLEGSRVSLLIGIWTTFGGFALGIAYALLAYRLGGWRDQMMMRLAEILLAIPSIVAISVLVLFLSNIWIDRSIVTQSLILAAALTLASWVWSARQVRTWIQTVANQSYVESAVAIGAPWSRIVVRHILPNLSGTIMIFLGLQIPQQLLFESFLSFVGLGIQPPSSSWGILIQEGWKTLSVYPHLILGPAGVLFLTVLSFNYIFEEFRENLDPRLR